MVFENIVDISKRWFAKHMNGILKRVDEPMEKLFWNAFLILFFTFINWVAFNYMDGGELSIADTFYYTITTHFTIGFGDLSPIGSWTRVFYYIHISLVWFINMVPAGLTVFNELKKTEKKPFPGQQKLERQSKFSSISELPKGRRTTVSPKSLKSNKVSPSSKYQIEI